MVIGFSHSSPFGHLRRQLIKMSPMTTPPTPLTPSPTPPPPTPPSPTLPSLVETRENRSENRLVSIFQGNLGLCYRFPSKLGTLQSTSEQISIFRWW
ncbi:hypothetical protein LINPERPRIM_LOCUS37364, partial [Linum perenne]